MTGDALKIMANEKKNASEPAKQEEPNKSEPVEESEPVDTPEEQNVSGGKWRSPQRPTGKTMNPRVYVLKDFEGKIVYVGETTEMEVRLNAHARKFGL